MRPLASLSLDLDNLWSYQMTHGEAGWDRYDSYLDVVVPLVLEFLAARDQRITFFVVGQDAALERNHHAIRAIAEDGHEIGNHSFRHEPWLHRYSPSQIDAELEQTEDALVALTGRRPVGFRGPGYSLSEDVLLGLVDRGYEYDCTTLPSVIGPLARWYFFRSVELTAEQRAERGHLFGSASEGMRPLHPYEWVVGCEPPAGAASHHRPHRPCTDEHELRALPGRLLHRSSRGATSPTPCGCAVSGGWSRRSCSTRSTSSGPTTSASWASSRAWPWTASASGPSWPHVSTSCVRQFRVVPMIEYASAVRARGNLRTVPASSATPRRSSLALEGSR